MKRIASELSEIIKERIHSEGPISFAAFMEMALYYPGMGYYMAGHDCIGTGGDFYTSSSLGPAFGAMIAKQLVEMWQQLGCAEFTVVEYGAGTGALCCDILDYFRQYTDLYYRLRYVIIEKSPAMRAKEQAHLPKSIRWCQAPEEPGEFAGCVLSNELLDNFAVHQVVMQEQLMEVFVDGNFAEVLRPASEQLINYFADLGVTLPKGFRSEVNLEAGDWLACVARYLKKGFVMTIDYGYETNELYKNCRSRGTLLCYRDHDVSEQYFDHIGRQDITAHVNFYALRYWGEQVGLSCCGLVSQAHFLLALDLKDYLRKQQRQGDVIELALQEVHLTRKLLIDMGNKFKVLIQSKNVPPHPLTGLANAASAVPSCSGSYTERPANAFSG